MRKRLVTLAALMLLAGGISETSGQGRFVIWSGDASCGQKGRGIGSEESIRCTSLDTPRGKVSAITHDSLSLAIAIVEEDDHYVVGTKILNRGGATIQFDTDLWGAAHFKKSDNEQGRTLLRAETSVPARDLVRGISSAASQDASADTFMAEVSRTSEVREQRRPDGTRVRRVVIAPDQEAKQSASQRSVSRQELAAEEKVKIRASALSQKWLAAGGTVKGLVYFRRVKKADLVVFSLKIEETNYIFRLLRNPQK
jgi:hypothetical protein